jgi:hypothetical protein
MIHMKRYVLLLSLLTAAMAVGQASAEVREFTQKDGTAVFGEIIDYNMKTDAVKIKTDQGKTVSTKAGNFLDEDFMYIRDWDAVRLFSQNTDFRIYLNGPDSKNKWTKYLWYRRPGKLEPQHIRTIDFNRVGYEIKFDNQTGYDLENVDIKYCIFYEQQRMDHKIEEKVTDLVVRPSIHHFAIVPDGLNKKFDSNSIVLRRHQLGSGTRRIRYLEGDGYILKNQMIGMIFRASITTLSGQTAVREMRMPRDLSEEYVWIEPTEENTVWPDDDLDEREDTQKPPTQFELEGGSDEDEDGE